VKRSIVKLGPATLTVSLPSKWTKKHHLQAGNELDLREDNNTLIVSTTQELRKEKITLDLTSHQKLLKRLFAAQYLKGADEIEVTTSNNEKTRIIQRRTEELIGMEIINQEKNKMLIKDLSGGTEENFDNVLKRVLYLLHSMSEELRRAITNEENDLQYLEDMEKNINKFTDYCFRLLNKNLYPESKKIPILYCITYLLEELGDNYKKLVKEINKTRLDARLITLYEQINTYHKNFEKLYLKYTPEKAIQLAEEHDKIMHMIMKEQEKIKSTKEVLILVHYENIVENIIKLMGQLLILN